MLDTHLRRGSAALIAAALLALTGCGGGSDPKAASSESPDPSSTVSGSPVEGSSIDTTSAYPSGVPASVDLTAPGSSLSIGETATVAFTPAKKQVAVVEMKVTEVEHTSFKTSFQGWQLGDVRDKNPYFVHLKVTNIGSTPIKGDGAQIPVYALDGANTLVMHSTFGGTFTPCMPSVLPDTFKPGKSASLCLVYLMPDRGELLASVFRYNEMFDPITWTGPVTELKADNSKKSDGKSTKGSGSKGSGTKGSGKSSTKNGKKS